LKRKRKQITISQSENTQKPENPLEKLMYYHVGVETYAKQIFKNLHIEPELKAIFNSLEKKHLRPSADKIFKNWVVVIFVILLILFLGITKLYCATVLNKPYTFGDDGGCGGCGGGCSSGGYSSGGCSSGVSDSGGGGCGGCGGS